jgi:hypothetical protein
MTTTTLVAGVINNNVGTIMGGGTIADSAFQDFAIRDSIDYDFSDVVKAVSPASSGNLGTQTVLSNSDFAKPNREGKYIGMIITTEIAGVANTTLQGASADFGYPRRTRPLLSARRLDEDSWDYETGDVTKGGSEGDSYDFHSPSGGTVSDDASGFPAIPGELVYMVTGTTATQDDYDTLT